jgi:dTDP-4-amino-4,6-dideoxygalactose transaminase
MNPEVKVPFVNLGLQYKNLRTEILAKFDDISSRGAYILNEDVTAFEQSFADYCGVKHAVSVGNGSDALVLCLHALGVGPGDEVITAPNSFIASAWVIARVGATPVFADIREDYNIDPERIREAVTPRTKAILPVHLTGRPAAMREIREIAKEFNLFVVEDAAQAIGAKYYGQSTGSLGDAGCFSLHPLKNLHVHGDGGMITTNSEDLFNQLVLLRNHGLKNRDECVAWGFNSRLDGIQAAIGNIKMKHLGEWTHRFRKIAERYTNAFRGLLHVPSDLPHEESVYHRYVVRSNRRDALQQFLATQGVETKVNYPIPIHLQEVCQGTGYRQGDFPIAERFAGEILSLPIYAELEDAQVDWVIDAVRRFHA